jgi:predicted MFS family arabinose efflux permease
MWAYQVVLAWLVITLTNSPFQLGLAFSIRGVSFIVGGFVGGAWADRFDRRTVVEVIQSLMIFTVATLGVVTAVGEIRPWHLFVGTFVIAGCHGVGNPTRQSMFRDVVPANALANAVSTNAIGMNLTRLIGPAGAGAFLAFVGGELVFFFSAAAWIVSTLSISRIEAPPVSSQGAREAFVRSLANGVKYARRNEVIAGVLLMTVVFNVIAMSFQQLLSAYAKDDLGLGAAGFGAMMSSMGLGAVIGAVAVTFSGTKLATGATLIYSVGVSGGCLVALGAYPRTAVAAPLLVLIGACSGITLSVSMVLIQTNVEDGYRGRAMSLFLLTHGLQYVAALPIGTIADAVDTSTTYFAMGIVTALATGGLALWSRPLRTAVTGAVAAPPGAAH